jgi:hypothetical protein
MLAYRLLQAQTRPEFQEVPESRTRGLARFGPAMSDALVC